MGRRYFLFIFFFIYYCSALSQTADSLKYMSLEPYDFHLRYLAEDSALLIDAREFFEYKRSRIHGATLISPSKGFDAVADTLNKNYSLFIYCHSGGRSSRALLFFYEKGFYKLYNLEGGIIAWRKDRFPVERKRIKRNKY